MLSAYAKAKRVRAFLGLAKAIQIKIPNFFDFFSLSVFHHIFSKAYLGMSSSSVSRKRKRTSSSNTHRLKVPPPDGDPIIIKYASTSSSSSSSSENEIEFESGDSIFSEGEIQIEKKDKSFINKVKQKTSNSNQNQNQNRRVVVLDKKSIGNFNHIRASSSTPDLFSRSSTSGGRTIINSKSFSDWSLSGSNTPS